MMSFQPETILAIELVHSSHCVVHIRDQGNTKKKLFSMAKCDLCESQLRIKMNLLLRKTVLLDTIRGIQGLFFKPRQTCPPKSLNRGQFRGKIVQNSCLGAFFMERENRDQGMFLKTPGHACVQHQYPSAFLLPPLPQDRACNILTEHDD